MEAGTLPSARAIGTAPADLAGMRRSILRLGEALERPETQELPPRSVAVTFDDGAYDFYRQAYPLLKKYGVPVTV